MVKITLRHVFGVFCILYGVFKISIAVIAFFLPTHIKHKLSDKPVLNLFFAEDESIASMGLALALLVYGIFTFFYGLYIFNVMRNILWFYEKDITHYAVFSIIGVSLVILYTIVLDTDLLSKDETQIELYKMTGLVGGYLFLMTLPLVYFHKNGFVPKNDIGWYMYIVFFASISMVLYIVFTR